MRVKSTSFVTFLLIGGTLCYADLDVKQIPELLHETSNIIPVAIIGSGPAGLSAAIPPARSGYHTVVFQGSKPRGELSEAYVVENWPGVAKASGEETMQKLETQVRQFGVHLVPLVVTKIDVTKWPYTLSLNDSTQVHALTVICATGSTQQKLGIEGEDTYWGNGLFSCGLCDGSYARNKDTSVIGSGDIAVQRVLQLAPDAKKVTLIVPRSHLTAHETMQKKILSLPNVTILFNKEAIEILGTQSEITHVKLRDISTQESSLYPTTSIFLSTGLTPNTELFKGVLPCEKNGCLSLRENSRSQQTPIEGIMAAGTVSDQTYQQVAAIAGDGTKAGMDALSLLSKWGFDGPLRPLASKKLYAPPTIPHPFIKKLGTLEEFEHAISSPEKVLIEFYSKTCTSCRKMEGPFSTVTEEFKPTLRVYNVERDALYSLIEKYDINLLPSFLIFSNGQEIGRLEGESTLEQLHNFIATTTAQKAPQK